MDIKNDVKKLREEMVALRRDFHRHPELGHQEYRTSKVVEDYLTSIGIEVRKITETGLVGKLVGGKPGKKVMLRCDMDALPVYEDTGLVFASENKGVAHNCGHDGHLAIHLITAKILATHKEELCGTIYFVFQPNEETTDDVLGAQSMIDHGVLDEKPDAIFGFHLWTQIPTGEIGIVPGPIMGSSYFFNIKVIGKGGHCGAPHAAVNPIDCASHILQAMNSFNAQEIDPVNPTGLNVCTMHAGSYSGIIPETLEMSGTMHCLHPYDQEARRRLNEIVEGVCRAFRCKCEITYTLSNSLLSNDDDLAELVRETAACVVGEENVLTKNVAVMVGDDFAEFSQIIPGAYYFVGTRSEKAKSIYDHHNPAFTIDEESLPIGVEMAVEVILKYLNKKE